VSSPETLQGESLKMETRALHTGRHIDPATGAVTTPIYLSTTFDRSPEGDSPRGYVYSRRNSPNRSALEECLADLEGGSEGSSRTRFSPCIATSSRLARPIPSRRSESSKPTWSATWRALPPWCCRG
jgi:cystathionine beta-lyase/cystathionine gamma-synthase